MITVICPVLNEAEFIESLIENFLSSNPQNKELIIIDGGSIDKTVEIVKKWSNRSKKIRLIHNRNKFVPFALNEAIKSSYGDPIIRLDAHTVYEKDYFEKILSTFEKTESDIVGGPMRAVGKTIFQKSVAYCTSTIFGIGDSKIHNQNFIGESDHVYLGAWRRNIFNEIGFFDENLKRNQDDEFHYRAKSFGKKIYLNSEIKSYYFPRSSLAGLFKQYFQYGLYKPLVLKKVKSELKLRHLVPSFFIIYLISLIYLTNFFQLIPLIFYLILLFYFSLVNNLNFIGKILSLIIYSSIHISYGFGFIIGIKNLIGGKKTKVINESLV